MPDAQAEFEQAVPDYTCNECGDPYPREDLVEISDHLICGSCKPLVIQRVKEGGSVVESQNYGGFGIRAGAKILDGLILGVIHMFLYIGYIMAAFDDEKRTLHDRIASTRVIKK